MTAQATPSTPAPAASAPAADVPITAPPARRKRFARWRPGVALAAVIAALLGSQAIAVAIMIAAGGDDAPAWAIAVGIVLADLALVGVVIAFARRGAENLGPATLGIRRTAFWPAVGWMVLTYFVVTIFNVFWILVVGTGSTPGEEAGGSVSAVAVVLVVLGVCITAPIAEELAFRGYLFPALARWRGPWIGALATAILFGAAHCAVYPPELLPMMAVFGFAACMLFWFTGSLLPCIALHAMNNALVTGRDLGWGWEVPLLMLGCMALALLVLAPFARERAPQPA